MTTRFAKALLAASLTLTAAAMAPTLNARAATPRETCREAIKAAGALHGVCFWSEEGYQGTLKVHTDPKPPSVCGNIAAAQSAVNLTTDTRKFFANSGCHDDNYLSELAPNGESDDLDPTSDVPAESWR
ncbi:hypothetical protein ACFO3J_21585 [Streptomyces polygonati]|uniref:Uncharacterized protein n=1 Tax=Streptomyces polygonati TaxID=1617087 RepID=A0ABV8HSB9_9ACTN